MKFRLRPHNVFVLCIVAACSAYAADSSKTVAAVLEALRGTGVDVIYSSELVPADLPAPDSPGATTPLQRAQAALAANGLALRALGPRTYVVVRAAEKPAGDAADSAPLEEVSVYASRYSIEGRGLAEPRELSSTDIEIVPGSHDDALHALRSLPGLASNASARPYIRGSLTEDVLVRYDGVTLLDPFHLKNFQSLISAIDPAAIERIEVFSGGFPVRFGTRSGGVIDIDAPTLRSGYENRVGVSLISAGVSSIGVSERWPVEWLATLRRSTLDLIDPVEDGFGKPRFSDSLGRLRWTTGRGAWTLGWLLLDDRLELGVADDEELATGKYRDEYLWLSRDQKFNDTLQSRTTLVTTSAERDRAGTLQRPGVAFGDVDESRKFNGVDLTSDWRYAPNDLSTYMFGAGVSMTRAASRYERHVQFSPEVAAGFGRPGTDDLDFSVNPRVVTYALHGSSRHQWAKFEGEVGLRFDAQHYNLGGNHTQVSPRVNLRYDFTGNMRLYASAGRFTQAQHVEEWRIEEAQQVSDSSQVSIHSILGFEYETDAATRFGIEVYSKRWTTASPYFDNELDPLSLLPDLAPDRIRIAPHDSEATGFELSVRAPLSDRFTGWGTLAWSRVADGMRSGGDVLRSWDQPLSLSAGLAWQGVRSSVSALAGWHRGWPRTPFSLTAPVAGQAGTLDLGSRNTERWGDFYTLDLRGSWTWPLSRGDLTAVLELTNATNRRNECCAALELAEDGSFLRTETDNWLPTIVNIGVSYRWRN